MALRHMDRGLKAESPACVPQAPGKFTSRQGGIEAVRKKANEFKGTAGTAPQPGRQM